jgi:LDH2 family malate/lactate/ureidoglycolate dehydrogenase
MELTVDQARTLVVDALAAQRISAENARIVADHLIDAALCGHEYSSLPRVLAIAEEMKSKAPAGSIRIAREHGCFAHIDGGDNIGYAVSLVAIDKAIEIGRRQGVAIVTANNTWFSGRCAYYVERAARQGLIAIHTTNTTARVAPFGGADRLMGTNPFAIAFPSEDDPVVIDIGTSAITWGDVALARAKGEPLPAGVAVAPDGSPTNAPAAALDGAFLPWGGQRGSALALAVQLLGMLAGSTTVIQDTSNYGLFFATIDPRQVAPERAFAAQVCELRRAVTHTRPLPGGAAVRMPGDGSQGRRSEAARAGVIRLNDTVYQRIVALTAKPKE